MKIKKNKNGFLNMQLIQDQKDLLIGTLLGNGNLQTETKGRNWRYRALHKAEHKPYLDHKYDLLKDFCSTGPIYSKIFDLRTNKYYERYYINTKTNDCFRFYGNLFYTLDPKTQRMIKDVPINIEKFLTPKAVAYWYMDDGSCRWLGHSNAMGICTESFSTDGVHRLQKALKNLFKISTSLGKKTRSVNGKRVLVGYRIHINEANSKPFRELIQPYLVDCMKYKVTDGNRGHL
jgi:hypothetical protein